MFSSSREESCCFAHILLDHAASSDADGHMFPLKLFAHSFHHADHCQFSVSLSLLYQYIFYLFVLSLPVLGTTGSAFGSDFTIQQPWKILPPYEAFYHFMLMTLNIDFFHSCLPSPFKISSPFSLIHPKWDSCPYFCSQIPLYQSPKHHTCIIGAQFISCSEY